MPQINEKIMLPICERRKNRMWQPSIVSVNVKSACVCHLLSFLPGGGYIIYWEDWRQKECFDFMKTWVQFMLFYKYILLWPWQHGADSSKKNRDGATPLDLVRDGDQDVADLLRGNAALLDAAKKGNLARVQRLVTSENINCRDAQGRNSTPLHLSGWFSVCSSLTFYGW